MTHLRTSNPRPTACANDSNYKKGCRCDYCRDVNARNGRSHRKNSYLRNHGHVLDTDIIPSDVAVETLRSIRKRYKIPQAEIARAIGSTQQQVNILLNGRRPKITRHTHNRIMAVYDVPGEPQRFYATPRQNLVYAPYKRKLYSLFAQGWTKKQLREVLKQHGKSYSVIAEGRTRQKYIEAANAEVIDFLCTVIGDRHSTSNHNKKRMLKEGVYPQIHYDDDGRLIRSSLTQDQIRERRRVQSKHGDATGRGHGSGSRTGRRRVQ